jgi:hypothetical protein
MVIITNRHQPEVDGEKVDAYYKALFAEDPGEGRRESGRESGRERSRARVRGVWVVCVWGGCPLLLLVPDHDPLSTDDADDDDDDDEVASPSFVHM